MTQNLLIERTHYCLEVANLKPGDKAVVAGWVRKRRDLGNLVFVDLFDRSGILQVVFDPERTPELHKVAADLGRETVLTVRGEVSYRPDDAINREMATGKVELVADSLNIHNTSEVPPFHLLGDQEVSEELRLRYRYLDLRRTKMLNILKIRHETNQIVRRFYSDNGFLEVVTPHLFKSTPEGARDFLVPSRLYPGSAYALPQSPQLLKQILMIAGVDKYFQIVKCFRDEDSRADRQPEFSQIDVEMSFTSQDTLFEVHEKLMCLIFKEILDIEVKKPFIRMTYQDAMLRYGSDKPDLRFEVEISDLTHLLQNTGFGIIDGVIRKGGVIRGLIYPGGARISRKGIMELESIVKKRGAGGLIALKRGDDGNWSGSPLGKLLSKVQKDSIIEKMDFNKDDLLCCVAGDAMTSAVSLGDLRLHIGRSEHFINEELKFLWVTEFPMFEYDDENNRYAAMHHPFTAPFIDDVETMISNPADCRAQAYDLVLNGVEIGGGSVRIHNQQLQSKVFEAIGMNQEQAERQFGFFLNALKYGTPPHCGIAFGMDRLIMLLAGTNNLRDVIAFPKTLQAACLLTGAPSAVTDEQLDMVHLKRKQKKLNYH